MVSRSVPNSSEMNGLVACCFFHRDLPHIHQHGLDLRDVRGLVDGDFFT